MLQTDILSRVQVACVPALVALGIAASVAVPVKSALAQDPVSPATLSAPPGGLVQESDQFAGDAAGEVRGMWVVRESLSSPKSVHQIVVTATKYHINTLFVQVRGRGDAWYQSSLEPRAEVLARQPESFDPLEQIVREGHAAGLKVHAWLNTYLTWSGSHAPMSPQHLWNAHRDWFACARTGSYSAIPTAKCEGAFLQPSSPEVQEHLFRVFTDVASRYDLDGIQFDYCRYAGTDYDFSSATLHRFRDHMATKLEATEIRRFDARCPVDRLAYVHAFGDEWANWRRTQITDLVTRISHAVKSNKPFLQVSAAVFPNAQEAFIERGQDWRSWLQSDVLDAVALMAYDRNTAHVIQQTRDAVAIAGEKHVYTGVGAWRLDVWDVASKIAAIRKAGAAGVNLFSYDSVHTRPRYLDTLARGVFASRSAPRRMRWLPSRSTEDTRAGAVESSATPLSDHQKTTTNGE